MKRWPLDALSLCDGEIWIWLLIVVFANGSDNFLSLSGWEWLQVRRNRSGQEADNLPKRGRAAIRSVPLRKIFNALLRGKLNIILRTGASYNSLVVSPKLVLSKEKIYLLAACFRVNGIKCLATVEDLVQNFPLTSLSSSPWWLFGCQVNREGFTVDLHSVCFTAGWKHVDVWHKSLKDFTWFKNDWIHAKLDRCSSSRNFQSFAGIVKPVL